MRSDAGGGADLWRARLADGALAPLAETPALEESWPGWSDAAQRLVFLARDAGDAGAFHDLWSWTPGERAAPIARTPDRDESFPSWIPGAAALVYAFAGPGPESGVAWLALGDGGSEIVAEGRAGGPFLRPIAAPDGSLLVSERPRPGGGASLWRLARGEPPRALTREPALRDERAFFTRGGEAVVFTRGPAAGGPRALYRIPIAGGEPALVVAHAGADVHAGRPSPARDELAFVSTRDGSADLFLADLDGSRARNLTRTPGRHEGAPRWSPDGERILVVYGPAGEALEALSAANARLAVLDREGHVLLDVAGSMGDWMPPW